MARCKRFREGPRENVPQLSTRLASLWYEPLTRASKPTLFIRGQLDDLSVYVTIRR